MKMRHAIAVILLLCFFTIPLAAQVYWEDPAVIATGTRFPQVVSDNGTVWVYWHRFVSSGSTGSYTIQLSSFDGKNWSDTRTVLGPIPFDGVETPLISAVRANGRNFIARPSPTGDGIIISASDDSGYVFTDVTKLTGDTEFLVPRMYARRGGGLILFMTKPEADSLTIYYAESDNGTAWSTPAPFVGRSDLVLNFLPVYSWDERGREYVVFQSLYQGERQTYQLYVKTRDPGGVFTDARILTTFSEALNGSVVPSERWDNQRAFIKTVSDGFELVWERRANLSASQIYYSRFGRDGSPRGEPERIVNSTKDMFFPQIVDVNYGGEQTEFVLWFDGRRGNDRIFWAQKRGAFWFESDLSQVDGNSGFPHPVILNDSVYLLWENRNQNLSRLYMLAPDRSVPRPGIRVVGYDGSLPSRSSQVELIWTQTRDSSGIAGFSYSWSRNPDDRPVLTSASVPSLRQTSQIADEDGLWYFTLQAQDYAGNWSQPTQIVYERDTTPPDPPEIIIPDRDEEGYLTANSFSISWQPPPQPDADRYRYGISYVGFPDAGLTEVPAGTTVALTGAQRVFETGFQNLDNGYWVFSVTAIDRIGNEGEPARVLLPMNKYIPVTYITFADPRQDDLGTVNLQVIGRGFTESGAIQELYLDRDGKPPYDYLFRLSENAYRVLSDRLITGPVIEDVQEGSYRIGLLHPTRGLYFSRLSLQLEPSGTVKFGDFTAKYQPSFTLESRKMSRIDPGIFFLGAVLLFLGFSLIFVITRAGLVLQETRDFAYNARALVTGDPLLGTLQDRKKREESMRKLKQRGVGLRVKFALIIMLLILIVVLMVSLPLGYYMITTQRNNLAVGLFQRSRVLLESMTSGVRSYLPSKNSLELSLLPKQIAAMDEARYATITDARFSVRSIPTAEGEQQEQQLVEHIWASNDETLNDIVNSDKFTPGSPEFSDDVSSIIAQLGVSVNEAAVAQVSALSAELKSVVAEAQLLALKTDAVSIARSAELQAISKSLNTRIDETLRQIGSVIDTWPAFDPANFDSSVKTYLFFQPVVYRVGSEDTYFRGAVRIAVSSDTVVRELLTSQERLVYITGVIALAALVLGMIGALVLATITINPIKRLVVGVQKIRDTEDKEELKDHVIQIRSRDELRTLADTINEMTYGLYKAAQASKDLTVGKDIQKMYIPLDKDSHDRKMTAGKSDTPDAEFFGYYEGAKGVSGDYFDYVRLDNEHYAIIKCDVSGKGVPAALIMVEVATIFLNYFKDWTLKTHGLDVSPMLYRLNDLLEERGFKGRFAALTVIILNVKTGKSHVCNAGDRLLHICDAAQGKIVIYTLPDAPAAGVFPSMLLEMKNSFQPKVISLKKGDVMLLYTDGLEESKRHFLDANYQTYVCPGTPDNAEADHESHHGGEDNEEMGPQRIDDVSEAFYHKQTYHLVKYHTPSAEVETLDFDFSTCGDTAEEFVTALVSVEKVFRMYPDPTATEENRVMVDKRIDAFLKKHFRQYQDFVHKTVEHPERQEYLYYTNLREDDQYDDLTILGIRKK